MSLNRPASYITLSIACVLGENRAPKPVRRLACYFLIVSYFNSLRRKSGSSCREMIAATPYCQLLWIISWQKNPSDFKPLIGLASYQMIYMSVVIFKNRNWKWGKAFEKTSIWCHIISGHNFSRKIKRERERRLRVCAEFFRW